MGYIDLTEKELEKVVQEGANEDIRLTASEYLHFYNQGDIGSNSPALMIFLQDPNKYVAEQGVVVHGVLR